MTFNVSEIVVNKWGNSGVITRVDGQGIYVLWEDGSCGVNKDIDLYKTGRHRRDIVYFLSMISKE